MKNIGLRETNLLSLSYGRIIRKDIDSPEGLLPESFDTYQIVEEGDIVLRLTDLQNDQRSLRVGLVSERGIITSAYVALRKQNRDWDSRFLFYQLHSADIQKVFYNYGGGVRQSMKYGDLKWLPIVLPPAHEQSTIANFLASKLAALDSLIEKLRKYSEVLDERDDALKVEYALRGLDPRVSYRDTGFPWVGVIPNHWKLIALKRVADVSYGISLELDRRLCEGIRIISLPNVSIDGRLNLDEVPFIPYDQVSARDMLRKGDLLFNWRNGSPEHVGKTALFDRDGEYTHVSFLLKIRVTDAEVSPEYLKLALLALRIQGLFSSSKNQVNRTYNQTELRNLVVPIPPLSEQVAIVKQLGTHTADTKPLKNNIDRQLELLREYRSALIFAAVTGKIDVRRNGSQEAAAACQ